MDPIVITAPRLERPLLDTPAAVDRVDRRELGQGRGALTLDEALEQVPGLFFQNQYNFAQGLRISTRGFGARAPFGIRGIRLRVDGFPETLPDGQSQTDGIPLEAAERIEVIRGPAAVAYGNAAGGVIDVTTRDGTQSAYSPRLQGQLGSHGHRRTIVQQGGTNGPWSHHLSLDGFQRDGYREQSRTERYRFHGKARRRLGGSQALELVVNAVENPEAEDPGGLTRQEVEGDRRQATGFAEALDAGQRVDRQRLGLTWRDRDAAGGELAVRGFYTRRDFEQQLPFPGSSLLGFDRDFYGLGVDYAGRAALASMPLDYVVGAEADRQVDDRFRFSVDGSGAVQRRTADERQTAIAGGVFAQGDLGLSDALDVTVGVRFDRVRFAIDDDLTADGDDSGARAFDEWSASLGALYTLAPGHRVYANASTAFETPTFTEFADPDGTGGFNPAIEPQEALNTELGARGRAGGRLRYDVAVFRVEVRDEIVPFEKNGRTFYENAARTERDGVELGVDWIASEAVTLALDWTWSDYRFDRFVDRAGNDFTGNRLPGLPENEASLELDWQGAAGRYARSTARYVDSVYADNANNVRVDDYATLDLRLGRTWTPGQRRVDAWLGVDNVTGERYIANVRINASNGRYFEPAPERTFTAAVEIGF